MPELARIGATVDGFVADLSDYLGGEDGERLHKWAGGDRRSHELVARFEEEWDAAGAWSRAGGRWSSWITGAAATREPVR